MSSPLSSLNLKVFHDYDVRGIYPTDINEDFYYHFGKAVALYIKEQHMTGASAMPTIGVGCDARKSSPSLTASLIEGLTDYGAHVIDLGQISTELHYFASGTYKYDANIIVTASHNPKEYNGTKVVLKNALPLHGGYGLPEIKKIVEQDIPKAETKGTITKKEIIDDYIQYAMSFFDVQTFKPLKVVVDTGNGAGGPVWEKVIGKLGNVELIPLFLDVDGTFPNHHPDPIKDENIVQLIAKVKEVEADLGIAIDGDADRIFFVDNEGVKLSGSLTLALFIDHLMSKGEIGTFVYNASISRIVPETIKRHGGTAVKVRGGHAFFKEKLRETNGIFGGEQSGHYGYYKCFNSEMPLIYGLMMIGIISGCGMNLSEWRKEFAKYPESGEINFKGADSAHVLAELKETFGPQAKEVDEIDGTSFLFDNGWFIVRSSKTEPLLRLNMDADDNAILEERFAQVVSVIEKHGGARK